jgi:phosphatidylserine/phosphatidylglycerophosphate/cardiolipin synthase-like enzyme
MHFKTIIVDLKYAYIGTANLSGAGVGLKSLRKRNFELGFVTYDTGIIADIASTFMEVFNGKYCTSEGCHFFKNAYLEESCKGITWNQV